MDGIQQGASRASSLPTGDIEPVRIALEGGGIGRVIFSGSAATADDIDALIEVLQVQKRQLQRKAGRPPMSCEPADADLIAAAPFLLDVCKAARDWIGLDGDGISEPTRGLLLAAIAKAEGRDV